MKKFVILFEQSGYFSGEVFKGEPIFVYSKNDAKRYESFNIASRVANRIKNDSEEPYYIVSI